MKKKVITTLALVFCAAALVIGSVAGTLAYLRVSVAVTNTFTYGKVAITMDEAAVTEKGVQIPDAARTVGNRYMLMPGTTYSKDPVIHIGAESQSMFLFLKVDNGIAGLALTDEEASALGCKTIHDQLLDNGWEVYVDESDATYRNTTVTKTDSYDMTSTSTVYYLALPDGTANTVQGGDADVVTFTQFTTSESATEAIMTVYVNNNATVVVTAYAIQSTGEGIEDIHDAAGKFATEFASAKAN